MKVTLGLCQMRVTADKERNVEAAKLAVKGAAAAGAQIVVLPEMWNCPYSNDSFPTYAEDIDSGASTSAAVMASAAKAAGVVLVGGSIPERSGGRLYNTCCVYDADGSLLGKHRKVHLFDIDIPGGVTFRESDTLTAGSTLTVVDTRFGRIGLGICYDLRFAEMAVLYARRGVHFIIYPGAFNMVTGPVHWQLLQQARALDNQVFVASCSPARDADASYVAWGHSMVVGPFAEVVAAAGAEAGLVIAEVDLAEIEKRRTAMPVQHQKRADLYEVVDRGD